jgi:hypothetical protein
MIRTAGMLEGETRRGGSFAMPRREASLLALPRATGLASVRHWGRHPEGTPARAIAGARGVPEHESDP